MNAGRKVVIVFSNGPDNASVLSPDDVRDIAAWLAENGARSHDIVVLADSPGVGANLSDHPMVPAMWHTPKSRGLWEQAGRRNLARWQLRHSGPLTTNATSSIH